MAGRCSNFVFRDRQHTWRRDRPSAGADQPDAAVLPRGLAPASPGNRRARAPSAGRDRRRAGGGGRVSVGQATVRIAGRDHRIRAQRSGAIRGVVFARSSRLLVFHALHDAPDVLRLSMRERRSRARLARAGAVHDIQPVHPLLRLGRNRCRSALCRCFSSPRYLPRDRRAPQSRDRARLDRAGGSRIRAAPSLPERRLRGIGQAAPCASWRGRPAGGGCRRDRADHRLLDPASQVFDQARCLGMRRLLDSPRAARADSEACPAVRPGCRSATSSRGCHRADRRIAGCGCDPTVVGDAPQDTSRGEED